MAGDIDFVDIMDEIICVSVFNNFLSLVAGMSVNPCASCDIAVSCCSKTFQLFD